MVVCQDKAGWSRIGGFPIAKPKMHEAIKKGRHVGHRLQIRFVHAAHRGRGTPREQRPHPVAGGGTQGLGAERMQMMKANAPGMNSTVGPRERSQRHFHHTTPRKGRPDSGESWPEKLRRCCPPPFQNQAGGKPPRRCASCHRQFCRKLRWSGRAGQSKAGPTTRPSRLEPPCPPKRARWPP